MNVKTLAQIMIGLIITALLLILLLPGQYARSSSLSIQVTPAVLPIEDVYFPIVVNNDGSSSCEAIQNAIDALPPEGGQVLLSAGTFTCSTAIVIDRDHVDLRGRGTATILSLADGANSPVIVVGQTATPPAVTRRDIRISDLTIHGNRQKQTQECWGGPCDSGGLTSIRNNGITLRRVSDVRIENVSVDGTNSGGLVTEKDSQRITVRGFSSSNNQFDGLAAYETENSIFTELYLHDNPFTGLSFDLDFNNNIINNAVITNNGQQGIFMRDSRDNVFSAVQIRGSGAQGIFLAQASEANSAATGNTFSDLTISNSVSAGLRVNDPSCTNNLVTGSQFSGNQGCISEAVSGLVQQSGVVCR